MSRLDQLYRSLLLTKFFTRGWGNPDNLKKLFEFRKILSCREECQRLVPPDYPVHIDDDRTQKGVRFIEGHFVSPFTLHLPNIMPKESEIARFQMILPSNWDTRLKPVCIHLAGTGDHYYWRRRTLLARPLLKEAGIASIILENPYYGVRKPKQQIRSSLHNVSDLFVMGGALVLESLVLLRWCESQGYGPLGMTGISMGGHMASVAATNWHKPICLIPILSGCTASCIYTEMASLAAASWPKPIVLVPCLSWSTASIVFTQGVLSGAIPWKLLQDQYFADHTFEDEIAKLIESPEERIRYYYPKKYFSQLSNRSWRQCVSDVRNIVKARKNESAFDLGQKFARDYPTSISNMETLHKTYFASDGVIKKDTVASVSGLERPIPKNSVSNILVPPNPGSTTAQFHTTTQNESFRNNLMSTIDRLTHHITPGNKVERQKEALCFMRGVMDECTHLGNFTTPVDTSLVIIIAARSDAYIPRTSVLSLLDLWPGSEVRYIDTGHISAFLFKQGVFRKAIIDAFDRKIKKYYS